MVELMENGQGKKYAIGKNYKDELIEKIKREEVVIHQSMTFAPARIVL